MDLCWLGRVAMVLIKMTFFGIAEPTFYMKIAKVHTMVMKRNFAYTGLFVAQMNHWTKNSKHAQTAICDASRVCLSSLQMPRQALDSDSDSQKENQGIKSPIPRRAKVERSTTVVGHSAKSKRVASRVSDEDEEDEHHSDDGQDIPAKVMRDVTIASESGDDEAQSGHRGEEDEVEEDGSPNGRKRARINESGDSIPVKKENANAPRRVTLPRDKDG